MDRKPAAINIIFDGPPGPEGGRFIEVETDDGKSVRVGEWQQRKDGNWGLRMFILLPPGGWPDISALPPAKQPSWLQVANHGRSMTTNPPTEPMDTTPRDPHLPPPEVVDWLLGQTWPGEIPETRIDYQGGNPSGIVGSTLLGWQQAYVDIGADAGGRIFLDSDALDALRKDHASRKAARL